MLFGNIWLLYFASVEAKKYQDVKHDRRFLNVASPLVKISKCHYSTAEKKNIFLKKWMKIFHKLDFNLTINSVWKILIGFESIEFFFIIFAS